ncbi:hypothetical protein SEA_DIXON_41 [Mycobacterium phage Dixon]|nr:hypothetical protein SEA_DIXON_41 [Mycobacterium phage Dixon]
MGDIDQLHESTQHVIATPQDPTDHFLRSQAHALIDIAESLRVIKDYVTASPIRFIINDEGI